MYAVAMPRDALTSGSSARWLCAWALWAFACGNGDDSLVADGGSGGVVGKAGVGGVMGSVAGTQAGLGGVTGGAGGGAAAGSLGAGRGGMGGAAAVSGDDAGVPACSPCIDGSVSWGDVGGLVVYSDRSTLDGCNTYHRTRTPAGRGTAEMLACERSLPCMGSGLHGVSDVLQALQNTDVQAALAQGHVLFGSDPRPVDGTVLDIVARADTAIDVGSPCSGGGSCAAIPPGVSALAALLRAIDDDQLHLDPCRSMFMP